MPEDLAWIQRESRLREETLAGAFREFSSAWSQPDKADCFLNRALLLAACESYFRDIYRRKDFHDIRVADDHKRAGYIVKWLVKFRPIQYRADYISKKVSLANEFFALWVASEHLSVNVVEIPAGVVEHMIYHFRFRAFDADTWALSFFLLQKCSEQGVLRAIAPPQSS
jgi:hypothetical protein